MSKQLSLAREGIRKKWGKAPAAAICMRVLDFIEENDPQSIKMLTIGNLKAISHIHEVNDDFQSALTILTRSSHRVLEPHFLFIYSSGEEDIEIEIDTEELSNAERDGWLVHPKTGRRVQDFRKHIYTYFAIVPEILQADTQENG